MSNSTSLIRQGKCITFYSYKGGVGRSMALVNLSSLLAKKNKKVLVIDWDVEAPGLHLFFNVNNQKKGLVDFITDVTTFTSDENNNNEVGYFNFFENNLDDYIEKDIPLFNSDSCVSLDLLKAGKFGKEYSNKLSSINWLEIYKNAPSFFRTFAYYLESKYDYVLIDSRTGLSDSGGITTMLMPQQLILVFAINNQNINGVIDVAQQAIEYRRNSNDYRPLNVYPLPSRIENTVTADLSDWITIYKGKFEDIFKEQYLLDNCDLSAYFDRCSIPYYPIHAHGENIPVLHESITNPTFISYHYDRFLTVLLKDIPAWDVISVEQETLNEKMFNDRFIQAIKLQEGGNIFEAVLLLDSIIEFNSNSHLAYNQRGMAKVALEDYSGALADFEASLKLEPCESSTYFNRGNLKEKIDDYEGAILDYTRAIEFNENFAEAYRNRGRAKGCIGDDIGALVDLEIAVELKPAYTKKITDKNRREYPIIVGIDIGTTKILAVAGQKNELGKIEILGFGRSDSTGVSHGVVTSVDQCIASIEQAIEKCLQSNPNLEIKEAYVSITGDNIKNIVSNGVKLRENLIDAIDERDITQLLRDQYIKNNSLDGYQIIDVIPQGFMVDDSKPIQNPIGMSGYKLESNFNVLIGDKNHIRNIKRCVDKSNLYAREIVLSSIASAFAVMNQEDIENGVAVIDIGGGTTDLAVYYDGCLKYSTIIPYGGTNVTNDIRNGLGILRAQAEQIKIQFGTALADNAKERFFSIQGIKGINDKVISEKTLAHIIQARMQEILDYVVYHLKQAGVDNRIYGIILTGGGAQLKCLTELTEYITGLETRIGYPTEHLSSKYWEHFVNPAYATCIGLIIKGCQDFEKRDILNFAEGRNYLHITNENYEPDDGNLDETDETSRNVKRDGNIKRLFDGLQGKFFKIFEEVDNEFIQPISQKNNEEESTEFKIGEYILTPREVEERKRFEEEKKSLEERAERLRRMSFRGTNEEYNSVPAFVRRNIQLDDDNDQLEKEILSLYLGLGEYPPMTIDEIGRKFSLDPIKVKKIRDNMIAKLSNNISSDSK